MKSKILALLFVSLIATTSEAQVMPMPVRQMYSIGRWNADSLGNHRAVVKVGTSADAVQAFLPWRRRDLNPEKKNIVVTDANGNEISNRVALAVSRESGNVVFQPSAGAGNYYIYFMPYRCDMRSYPKTKYPEMKFTADKQWTEKYCSSDKNVKKLPKAELVSFEDIDTLNAFYPMELIATKAETQKIVAEGKSKPFLVFPEDRTNSIRMTTDIPAVWTSGVEGKEYKGDAQRGEYFCYQLGLYAHKANVKNVRMHFSDLTDASTGEKIMSSAQTCFNTDGTDVTGRLFVKTVNVDSAKVKSFWIGVDIPENQTAGTYSGNVEITADGVQSYTVPVEIKVENKVIANRGDNETWRMSRLRWLNSQKGEDDEVLAPYTPLTLSGRTISCLGREITLAPTGLPSSVKSYFDDTMTQIDANSKELLASPLDITGGGDWKNLSFEFTKCKSGAIAWKALNENNRFIMELEAQMEFDGNIAYKLNLIAKQNEDVDDLSLKAQFADGVVKYKTGLGVPGGVCPASFSWKWNVENNQDAVWLGDVNGGLQLRFYDDKYVRPLNTNFYHQQPLVMPEAWVNSGKGGIRYANNTLEAFTGARNLKQGQQLKMYFSVLITPFHVMDTEKQWADRYYHAFVPIDTVTAAGATVINVHHGTPINPFINYPFLRPAEMKSYIDEAHGRHIKVKIYDTVRELSNSCTELFALRSLDGEIFSKGPGGGYAWLQEHLDQDYIGAWFVPRYRDAAIINTAISRWHNYYVEGLDWLVKNVGIDGLYIDDLAFDRETMKRVRKVLMNTNPATRIDLHSANQFNPRDGFASSANLYMEHLPFLDRLWFGEYFKYESAPDYWLMEVSGVPFGLMGEMLQDGGNPWRGMVYGMTARLPWSGDPREVWKELDSFGVKGSRMIGYWSKKCPVKTDNPNVLATVYLNNGKALVALGSWADTDVDVHLIVDWNALGLKAKKAMFVAPDMKKFQSAQSVKPSQTLHVEKGKGLLVEIK
jgi:hypothetical protein